jgi:hypothetical protein
MQRLWPPMPATRRVLAAAAPRGASARLGAGGAARAGAARRCRARGSSAGHAQRGWRRRLRSATRPRARRGGETRRPRRGRTARRRSERRAAPRGRRRQRRNRCGCCDSRGRHAARPRREPQVRTSWRREREAIWRASAVGRNSVRCCRRSARSLCLRAAPGVRVRATQLCGRLPARRRAREAAPEVVRSRNGVAAGRAGRRRALRRACGRLRTDGAPRAGSR